MPRAVIPDELRSATALFVTEHRRFVNTRRGRAAIEAVMEFGSAVFDAGGSRLQAGALHVSDVSAAANATIEWLIRLPEELVTHPHAPVIDLASMPPAKAVAAMSAGLHVLTFGATAMLFSTVEPPEHAAEALLYAAFGSDRAAVALRRPLLGPDLPWAPPLPKPTAPDISKLVLGGTVRDLLRAMAECGLAFQRARAHVETMLPFGRVTRLTPDRTCAGGVVQIGFADFGAQPPPASISDISISLPTQHRAAVHLGLRSVAPELFVAGQWSDQGSIAVTMPDDIYTGPVGFFTVPVSQPSAGSCDPGTLASAAGMLQSVLGDQFGAHGVMFGQVVVNAATRAEAMRHPKLPEPADQLDGLNHLEAGAPVIDLFRVLEPGSVHPRGSVTVQWAVRNATQVQIDVRAVAGSENPDELPAIAGALGLQGVVTVSVPCTSRWEGEYVLSANNPNGCTSAAVQAVVALKSGYSAFRVGVAKADVTDEREGLGMAGFAYKMQKTSKTVHSRQFARAFVIEENVAADPAMVAIVVADIWTCTIAVKQEVLSQLNARFPHQAKPLFDDANLLIAGTHTHSGPGGYSKYLLYNLTIGGFDQGVFDTIVDGIVTAVIGAYLRRSPGRILVNAGDLVGCGANRSFEAFQRNPEFSLSAPELWTDREMMLLAFVVDEDNRGGTRPIGMLNWFAIHPTSLGMFNVQISADNKGWAATLFENDSAFPGLVAAFGNGNAGDVSGNVTLDASGNKTVTKPLGGDTKFTTYIPAMVRNPASMVMDVQRMEVIGKAQCSRALELFKSATTEVAGRIATGHEFVDMSNVAISNPAGARTWPAALGVSFGAGSSEDSIAYTTLDDAGVDIDAGILEGMTRAAMTFGGVQFWSGALALAPAALAVISATLATGVPPDAGLVPIVLSAITGLGTLPHGRSYAFASMGTALFPDELHKQTPAHEPHDPTSSDPLAPGVTWGWLVPTPDKWPADYVAGHGEKPIMLPVGLTRLLLIRDDASAPASPDLECPLVPHVLPLQLIKIGSVAIAGVPAEFTSTAGRRLKERLRASFGGSLTDVAVSNYSNGYSGYVTTPEEYGAQHYEGASTLYGPHTYEAYAQTFESLAASMIAGMTRSSKGTAFTPPAVFRKADV